VCRSCALNVNHGVGLAKNGHNNKQINSLSQVTMNLAISYTTWAIDLYWRLHEKMNGRVAQETLRSDIPQQWCG